MSIEIEDLNFLHIFNATNFKTLVIFNLFLCHFYSTPVHAVESINIENLYQVFSAVFARDLKKHKEQTLSRRMKTIRVVEVLFTM